MPAALIERDSCPGCSASNGQVALLEKRFEDGEIADYLRRGYGQATYSGICELVADRPLVVTRCTRCHLAYQRLAPNLELAKEIYDDWIDIDEAEVRARRKNQSAILVGQLLEIIHHFRRPARELRVLDFGAGAGEWCRIAAGLGFEVFGTDLSEDRGDSAAKNGVRLIGLDEISNSSYDFVNIEQVVEHLTWPLELIADLVASLTTTGVLRISVPNARDLDRRVAADDWYADKGSRRSLNVISPLEHVNAFRHDSLVAMGAAAGVRPVRRSFTQLRFTPMVGPFSSCLRYGLARFRRAVLR